MSRRSIRIVAVLALLAVGAIGFVSWVAAHEVDPPLAAIDEDAPAAVGVRYEYALLTHCGVDFVRFDGRWWEAKPHLDDGNGNPPEWWVDFGQGADGPGTMQLVTRDQLVYEAPGDRMIRFTPEPTAPPPQTCA